MEHDRRAGTAAESAGVPRPLPPGTRLLHIGPHKTGTTAIQGALFAAREETARHGVDFPALSRHPMEAVLAVCSKSPMMGDVRPTDGHYQRLMAAVAGTGRRSSVLSSEFFADAPDDATVRRVVEDLGGDRVHVLVTLRPLAKILASQWQQYVQNGLRLAYEPWLEHMLRKPPYEKPTPSFWRRHRHDRLIERWARVVGPDKITVVVVDDRDRDGLLRTFESLLGLPDGLLVPVPDTVNRSLTLGEAELLRHLNIEFRGRDLPERLYSKLVRHGAVKHLKEAYQPTSQEQRITTPRWALKEAAAIGGQTGETITRLGVQVVGNPALLSTGSGASGIQAGQGPDAGRVTPQAAAHALFGLLAAAAGKLADSTNTVDRTSSKDLAAILFRRLVNKLRPHGLILRPARRRR